MVETRKDLPQGLKLTRPTRSLTLYTVETRKHLPAGLKLYLLELTGHVKSGRNEETPARRIETFAWRRGSRCVHGLNEEWSACRIETRLYLTVAPSPVRRNEEWSACRIEA